MNFAELFYCFQANKGFFFFILATCNNGLSSFYFIKNRIGSSLSIQHIRKLYLDL